MENKQIKILLLEDTDKHAKLVEKKLEKFEEFKIICADTLLRGLEFLSSDKPDVVLLDLILPDSSGIDTFTSVYNKVPSIPIVILSSIDDVKIAATAVQKGAQDFLVKGKLDKQLLKRAIYYAIERKRIVEELQHSERELSIRNQIANIFLSIPDEEVYGQVQQVIQKNLDSKDGIFGYIDEQGAVVIPDNDRIFPKEIWAATIWSQAINEKKTFCSIEPFVKGSKGHITKIRSVSVPIIDKSEVVGIIHVANKSTDYDENDIKMLETVADNIAPVLNARLQRDQQEKKRKSAEDSLLKLTNELNDRLKELNCLYGISKIVEELDEALEEIFQQIIDLIPQAWQYPEITCAQLVIDGQSYKTKTFKKTNWNQTADINVDDEQVGVLEIYYIKEKPEKEEGPFSKEERNLLDAIARHLGKVIQRVKAGEVQRESEARWRALGENVPYIILNVDSEGKILFINRSVQGLTPDQIIGTSVYNYNSPEHHEILRNATAQVFETGEVVCCEIDAQGSEGTPSWYETQIGAIKHDGQVVSVTHITSDITDRKKMEKERARLQKKIARMDKELKMVNQELRETTSKN